MRSKCSECVSERKWEHTDFMRPTLKTRNTPVDSCDMFNLTSATRTHALVCDMGKFCFGALGIFYNTSVFYNQSQSTANVALMFQTVCTLAFTLCDWIIIINVLGGQRIVSTLHIHKHDYSQAAFSSRGLLKNSSRPPLALHTMESCRYVTLLRSVSFMPSVR